MHLATCRWAIAAIALTLWGSTGGPAVAARQQPASAQLRLDLDRLRSQIATLEGRLADMGESRETLVEEFEAADVGLALSSRRLSSIHLRLQVLLPQTREREAEVLRLTDDLAGAREELAARVVALYRMGPLSYSRVLLAAGSAEAVLANYQMVGRLAAQDRSLVARIRNRLDELEEAVRAASETTAQLTAMRAEETLAVEELTAQQDIRQELIRQIDIEAAAGRRALDDQEKSALALEELLGTVSSMPLVAPSVNMRPAFATTLGNLPWPAEGPITERFGRKQHAVYDTYTLVKGIEIAAGAGAPVRAVYQGRIVFADWYQTYGLIVIISHGDDFHTIYGHLDEMLVRTNEWVDEGDQLGTVGETGSLIGPSLYFEVRDGAEAVNPELWLRGRNPD